MTLFLISCILLSCLLFQPALIEVLQLLNRSIYNFSNFMNLFFSNYKSRGKSANIVLCGLGDNTVVQKDVSEVVSSYSRIFINLNAAEETNASDITYHRGIFPDLSEKFPHDRTHFGRILNQSFFLNDSKGGSCDSHCEWISTIGASMLADLEDLHDFVVTEHATRRNHTTTDRFTNRGDVSFSSDRAKLVLLVEPLSCSTKTTLNFVTDHQNVVLVTELTNSCKVSR
jgi:hypothetical protein